MIQFSFSELKVLLSGMQAIQNELEGKDDSDITGEFQQNLLDRSFEFEKICATFDIDVANCLSRLKSKILQPTDFIRPVSAFWFELRNRIGDELGQNLFLFIPRSFAPFYDDEMLFGKEVYYSFPSAVIDIKNAGNCYALGLHTACVFHLMRAVEIGAKVMVRSIKAQKYLGENKRGVFRKKPVELCDWKTIIDGLTKAKNVLEQGSGVSVNKKATLAFYSHAIAQFGYFKDAWRNTISHGHDIAPNRKFYLAGETKDIMDNTKHFLQHLSKRIKE